MQRHTSVFPAQLDLFLIPVHSHLQGIAIIRMRVCNVLLFSACLRTYDQTLQFM